MSLSDLFKEKPPAVTSSSNIPWPSADKTIHVAESSSQRQPFLTTSPLWNFKRSPSFREFLNPNYKSKLKAKNVDIGEEPIDFLSNLKNSGLSKAELLESTKKTVKTPKQSFKISSSQSHSTKSTKKEGVSSLLNIKDTGVSKTELESLRNTCKTSQQSNADSDTRKLDKTNSGGKSPVQCTRVLRSQSQKLKENDQKATPKTTETPDTPKASLTKQSKETDLKTPQSFSLKSSLQVVSKPSQYFTTTKPETGNVTSLMISDIISSIVKDKSKQTDTKHSEDKSKSSSSLDLKEQNILQRSSPDKNSASKSADNDDNCNATVVKKTSELVDGVISQSRIKQRSNASSKVENECDNPINKPNHNTLDNMTEKNKNTSSYGTVDDPLTPTKRKLRSSTITSKKSENVGTKRKLTESENVEESVDSNGSSPKKRTLNCVAAALSSGPLITSNFQSTQDQNSTDNEEIVDSRDTIDICQQHDSTVAAPDGLSQDEKLTETNDNPPRQDKVESTKDNKSTQNVDIVCNDTENSENSDNKCVDRDLEYSIQDSKPTERNDTEPLNMAKEICVTSDISSSEAKCSLSNKTPESAKMGSDASSDDNVEALRCITDSKKTSDIVNDVNHKDEDLVKDNHGLNVSDVKGNTNIENSYDSKDKIMKVNDDADDNIVNDVNHKDETRVKDNHDLKVSDVKDTCNTDIENNYDSKDNIIKVKDDADDNNAKPCINTVSAACSNDMHKDGYNLVMDDSDDNGSDDGDEMTAHTASIPKNVGCKNAKKLQNENDSNDDNNSDDNDGDEKTAHTASIPNTIGCNNAKKLKNDSDENSSDDDDSDEKTTSTASIPNAVGCNNTKKVVGGLKDIKDDDDVEDRGAAHIPSTIDGNDTTINLNDTKDISSTSESSADEDNDANSNTRSFVKEETDDSVEVLVFNDDDDMLEDGEIQWEYSDGDESSEDPEKCEDGSQLKTKTKRKRKRKRKGKDKGKKILKTSNSKVRQSVASFTGILQFFDFSDF